ncbi:hypothetical protein F5882DRAFT_416000 [Hyaloscypha sp. PMI_1271]|nr:hypothetical protein F5882DRAFT_416000 [Hyaloscypha sp. PMI_1271]
MDLTGICLGALYGLLFANFTRAEGFTRVSNTKRGDLSNARDHHLALSPPAPRNRTQLPEYHHYQSPEASLHRK